MIDEIIKKINLYKDKISRNYQNAYKDSSNISKNIYGQGKKRIEIEKLKISLKKQYYNLGLYIAKQYIVKGYSDFSLDEKFKNLNTEIKKTLINIKQLIK